uniref:Uncharacterized protein n=1 Tax=Rhizophora mucronata TaxID=61149 RepID=A0A2P2QAI3_RHIMU
MDIITAVLHHRLQKLQSKFSTHRLLFQQNANCKGSQQ